MAVGRRSHIGVCSYPLRELVYWHTSSFWGLLCRVSGIPTEIRPGLCEAMRLRGEWAAEAKGLRGDSCAWRRFIPATHTVSIGFPQVAPLCPEAAPYCLPRSGTLSQQVLALQATPPYLAYRAPCLVRAGSHSDECRGGEGGVPWDSSTSGLGLPPCLRVPEDVDPAAPSSGHSSPCPPLCGG